MQLLKDLVAFVKTEKGAEHLSWFAFEQYLIAVFSAGMVATYGDDNGETLWDFAISMAYCNAAFSPGLYAMFEMFVDDFKWFRREKSNGKA